MANMVVIPASSSVIYDQTVDLNKVHHLWNVVCCIR